jgi:hypothetical protein
VLCPANLERPRSLMRFAGFNRSRRGNEQSFGVSAPRQGMSWVGEAIEISRAPEMFLNIAATWESLANDRIKTAEGLERIAKLEKTARKSRKPS